MTTGTSDGKPCKRLLMGFIVAMAMGATANIVKVTKFHQSYPYSGKATIEYTVGGELSGNTTAEIILNTDDASATFTQKNIVAGANRHIIDFSSFFGGALVLTNASFVVTITQELGGVQLWKNGPYWAECNVGATKSEEYGYYFWWGDTVGYTKTGSGWISVKDGTGFLFAESGTVASTTYGRDNKELLSAWYIDPIGNLALAHDAATAYLGSPWRMPTKIEFEALVSNCTTTWTTRNGVYGRLISGKGDYADKSIFLPAAGRGDVAGIWGLGTVGFYWSSTPDAHSPYDDGWNLEFSSNNFSYYTYKRYWGHSVRPVRDFVK